MAKGAKNPRLKSAIETHLRETQGHVTRLEQVFQALGRAPKRQTCEAMKGLIAEGDEILSASGDDDVWDAALIGAAQKVEHYEIAAYGTARTHARRLGRPDLANLLDQTLREESAADQKLTQVAESGVNVQAASPAR